MSLQTNLGDPCYSCCSDKTVDHAKSCALFISYQSVKVLGWQPSKTVKPFKAYKKLTSRQQSTILNTFRAPHYRK